MPRPPISNIVVPSTGFDDATLTKIKELVSPEDFVRIANLSAENKAALKGYWTGLLGYSPGPVALIKNCS